MSGEGDVWAVTPAVPGLGKDVFAEHYGAPDGSWPSLGENSPAVEGTGLRAEGV